MDKDAVLAGGLLNASRVRRFAAAVDSRRTRTNIRDALAQHHRQVVWHRQYRMDNANSMRIKRDMSITDMQKLAMADRMESSALAQHLLHMETA